MNIKKLLSKSRDLNKLFKKHQAILCEYRNHVAAHIDGDIHRVWVLYKDDLKKRDLFILARDVSLFCWDFYKIVDTVFTKFCSNANDKKTVRGG